MKPRNTHRTTHGPLPLDNESIERVTDQIFLQQMLTPGAEAEKQEAQPTL
jgi:hypothetical protein